MSHGPQFEEIGILFCLCSWKAETPNLRYYKHIINRNHMNYCGTPEMRRKFMIYSNCSIALVQKSLVCNSTGFVFSCLAFIKFSFPSIVHYFEQFHDVNTHHYECLNPKVEMVVSFENYGWKWVPEYPNTRSTWIEKTRYVSNIWTRF